MTKFREVQVEKVIFSDDSEFTGSYNDLKDTPEISGSTVSGITSSFIVGFDEYIIENGLITSINEIWTYEGILTAGVFEDLISGNYFFGYESKNEYGSMDPEDFELFYWSNSALTIGNVSTIGNVMIDDVIIESSEFSVVKFSVTATLENNPFLEEGVTHNIKVQYT